jgi:putative DNA primase/helicase
VKAGANAKAIDPSELPARFLPNRGTPVALYDYTDPDGKLLYRVVRTDTKEFPVCRPVANGKWTWGLGGIERVLYRLPGVIAAAEGGQHVFVVEGEKDVEALEAVGQIATTKPGGKGGWDARYSAPLRGAHVTVVADNDDRGGRDHAADVAAQLAGVAASVCVVLPKEGKDAFDHLAAGFSTDEFVPLVVADTHTAPAKTGPTWEALLARAIEVQEEQGRHAGGVWLVSQTRDNGYQEATARQLLEKYRATVSGRGDHAYTAAEATATFNDLFFTTPREPWPGASADAFPFTDLGNAERLKARHGDDLRYVHKWRDWIIWDGQRWAVDSSGEIDRRANDVARAMLSDAAKVLDDDKRKSLAQWALKSQSRNRLEAMVDRTESLEGISVDPAQLDSDPWLLAVLNGTLDLMKGKRREPRRKDLITKLAPVVYDPDAPATTWLRFLQEIMPDEETREYLKRAVGYCLTGIVSEHVLFMPHGTGANGKSVFLGTLRAVLGDYAQTASSDLILSKRPGAIPVDAARLQGARFVAASESDDGSRLAESTVKQLTGGDRITARHLYGSPFEFPPTHKLWLATNHRPTVYGVDDAIWRRIRLIPFEVTIPPKRRDKRLMGDLWEERAGILAWAVRGCLEWQREGLHESASVVRATVAYRSDSDVFGTFLDERCELGARLSVAAADLFVEYERWAEAGHLRPMSKIAFGRKLRERRFEKERRGKANVETWLGIGLPNRGADGKFRIVRDGAS